MGPRLFLGGVRGRGGWLTSHYTVKGSLYCNSQPRLPESSDWHVFLCLVFKSCSGERIFVLEHETGRVLVDVFWGDELATFLSENSKNATKIYGHF